eukprot:278528_1
MSRAPRHTKNQESNGWVSVKPNTNTNRRKRRRKKNKTKNANQNKAKQVSTKPKHAAPPNAATIYCQWFQEGLCQRGSNCFFIHQLDPLSEKNPIEHNQRIKELMASSHPSAPSSNVQIQLKKPQPQTEEEAFVLPSHSRNTNPSRHTNHNTMNTYYHNTNPYSHDVPSEPVPPQNNHNPYVDAFENLKNYADPKWAEYVSDASSLLHTNADMNVTPNITYNNPYTQHFNPYLTAENAHTANPYAQTHATTTNPYLDPSALNVDATLVNNPTAFNEDDYEVWEDENGEIIVVEKNQMYTNQSNHTQYNAKQYDAHAQHNPHAQQRGIRSGGDTYSYGATVNAKHEHKAKAKPSATAYSSVARKFNDMTLNVGKVESRHSSNPDLNPHAQICRFWLEAQCMWGKKCKMAHRFATNKCPHCDKVVGTSGVIQQHHLRKCPSKIALEAESKISESAECGICREGVLSKGNTFGLLTGCTHCFCLKCIREWRGVLNQSKETTRSCPICRQITYFIVPCHRFITDPKRKKVIVEKYKQRLGEIRCKHFDDREECPFGSSCFYKHVRKDGTVDDKKVTLRHMINADGDTEIMKQMRLSEFLFGDLSD